MVYNLTVGCIEEKILWLRFYLWEQTYCKTINIIVPFNFWYGINEAF